jgi:ABC-type lipoprotein export system ATPase subunit
MKISCDSLSYRYPGAEENVFTDISIAFPAQVTLLRGYSGCGKSTLLRLAAGMLEPSSGSIRMEGIQPVGSREFFRKELSFVFQNLNLLPLASVERNLSISMRIAGVDESLSRKS